MNAASFWQSIKTIAEDTTNKYTPFRAKAINADSSGIQIQTYDSSEATGERYAKLNGPKVNAGDEVAVIPYGGSNLVLGTVGDQDITEFGRLIVKPEVSGTGTLLVQDANGVNKLIVDSSTGNGGITGSFNVGGNLTNRGSVVQPVDQRASFSSSAATPSTTSTTTYQTALSYPSWALAEGTWFISVVAGLTMTHSVSNGTANLRILVNGLELNPLGLNLRGAWLSTQTGGNLNTTSTGNITINVEYKAQSAGTVQAINPWFIAVARRTS